MNILVFPHLGLGDQLVMNGLVHYLLKNNVQEVCIIAMQYQKNTLENLYSDFDSVSFYWVPEINESTNTWQEKDPFLKSLNQAPFFSLVSLKNKEYRLFNFGCHSSVFFNTLQYSWADAFYVQAHIDPMVRKTFFTFPSNLTQAQKLYERILHHIDNSDYIIIHDDPSRERIIDANYVKKYLTQNKNIHLPVLYLGKQRYSYPLIEHLNNKGSNELMKVDSIFDYYYLIKNAKECHFIDSSIGIMTDNIKDSNTLLYNHLYVTSDGSSLNNTQHVNNQRKWIYLDNKFTN